MTESYQLRDLLLPELENEINATRKMIEHLPDGIGEYKPHEKSMAFAKLAGHMAQIISFVTLTLKTPELDFATAGLTPLHMESKQQLLAEFNTLADRAITDLKGTSDEVFHQGWRLGIGPNTIYAGNRYNAYRTFAINHIIHHRAQLGVYLRMNNAAVPATYGPSADHKS